jgi:glycosyltransferase involved in cell wall biosynthesis
MNILFVPSAIVYHRHSEITVENSPLWNYLVSRSAKIYAWIRNSLSSNDNPVSPMLPAVPSSASQQLIDTLGNYDQLINRHSIEELISRTKRFTVGIYNSYWSSFGGGERHALDLADIACKANCEVYLISESPFSLEKLQRFFNIRLDGVKTLVPGEVTESLTERFDIFINSTFCSTLVSRSEISYYITSFPQRNVPRDFASAYVFLHNSSYTSRWALRYWGEHRQKLLLPVLSFASLTLDEDSKPQPNRLAQCKEFVILSVGRFNYEGHCKNQHIIASVFSALCQTGEIAPQWQLVIAGAVDSHVHSSLSHFEATTKQLEGCNARVIPNADRSQIKNLYHSASIYMNAAGLGADPVNAPEKSEHFGIAAFEALLYGCRLVSYEHGGPALMIENSIGGFVFTHQEEMSIKLLQAISACELENSQERECRIQHNFDYCNKKIDEALYLAHSLFPSSSTML